MLLCTRCLFQHVYDKTMQRMIRMRFCIYSPTWGLFCEGHVCTVPATGLYRFETLVGKRNKFSQTLISSMHDLSVASNRFYETM